jgi:hypothetical protein
MSTTPAFRVWLGWRAAKLRDAEGWDTFVDHLKKIFIPATWQVMPAFGLLAYLPSVFTKDEGDDWPDETALLVYDDTDNYELHRKKVAGRAYGLLHQTVFEFDGEPRSRAAWAEAWPAPAPKLAAWWWPAASESPALAGADTVVVFVAFSHADAASASADHVHRALGNATGEAVIYHDKTMTFVWLATRGEQPASHVARVLQAAWPTWGLRAAHDAVRAPQPIDEAEGVALTAQQTLHFTAAALAERVAPA